MHWTSGFHPAIMDAFVRLSLRYFRHIVAVSRVAQYVAHFSTVTLSVVFGNCQHSFHVSFNFISTSLEFAVKYMR